LPRTISPLPAAPQAAGDSKPLTFKNKVIRVTGTVSEFRGSPQIELIHPD